MHHAPRSVLYRECTAAAAAVGLSGVQFLSLVLFCAVFALGLNVILFRALLARRRSDAIQEIFRLASEIASDGIFAWNLAQDTAFYSQRYWAILGYPAGTFPDTIQSSKNLLHPEDLGRVEDYIEKYLNDAVSEYNIVFRMRHHDASWVWIEARGRALYDGDGKPVRIVGAHTDITAVKAYEEQLEKAKEYAENANRAKTDFLAHMNHEIRTPLTAISGIAEIFDNARDNLDDRQKQLVSVLISSTSSLKDLVSDILDFSRIESGEVELDLEEKTFSLQGVFDQVISIVSLKVGEKSFRFLFDYSAVRKQKIRGDRARFRQILLNLIGNAIKFTDKGSVTVTATKVMRDGNDFLRVEVKDTGIGIDAQHLGAVFERFKQADSSVSRKYGGSGLGLPISSRLARLMGGDITVTSAPGIGSVFTLELPLRTADVQDDDDTSSGLQTALDDNRRWQSLRQKNILMVEDYEGNVVILSYLLETLQCNYDVAHTGLEAIGMWRDKDYDLILMDVQMPEMDGFTATAEIRRMERDGNRKHTPIIGMTAHALLGDKEKCIEAGMDTYLPKPLVELDLKMKMAECLDGKGAA